MLQVPTNARAPSSACATCHRRKLKCDKSAQGCYNCSKARVLCEYPPRERTPRRKRGPYIKDRTKREQELKQTIKNLEAKFEKLTSHLESHGIVAGFSDPSSEEGECKSDNQQIEPMFVDGEEFSSEKMIESIETIASTKYDSSDRISPCRTGTKGRGLVSKNGFWLNFVNEVKPLPESRDEAG